MFAIIQFFSYSKDVKDIHGFDFYVRFIPELLDFGDDLFWF